MVPKRDKQISPMTSRRDVMAIGGFAIVVALIVTFFVWPAQQLVDRRHDPYNYSGLAGQLLSEGFGANGLTKREASLYPGMIAAVYRLAGERPVLIQLIQCLFFAGTCGVVVDMGRRVYNSRTGALAGLLVALNPLLLRYVPDLHMETMLAFAVVLNVWTMVRFFERQTVRNGIYVGLAAGFASLTKGVALVPAFLFGAIWVILAVRHRWQGSTMSVSWGPVIAFALATVAVILPWTARNYQVTGGRFVLIGPGLNDAFLRGYVFSRLEYALLLRPPYVDAENESNEWLAELCRQRGVQVGRDEVQDEQIFADVAKAKIVAEPLELLRKTAVGLFTFWYQMTTQLNSIVAGLLALLAWALAFCGFARSRREGKPNWLLLMPILSMNVFIALLCSLGRYSIPILPLLMVLAAFGLDTLLLRGTGRGDGVLVDRAVTEAPTGRQPLNT